MASQDTLPQNLANEISYSVIGRYFPSSYSREQIKRDSADRNAVRQMLMSMALTSNKFSKALDTFISLINQIIPDFKGIAGSMDLNGMLSSRIDKITDMIEKYTTETKTNSGGGGGGFKSLLLAGAATGVALTGMTVAGQTAPVEAASGPINPGSLPISTDIPPEAKAVLASIASVESPGYNAINYVAVGQGHPKFVKDLSRHPFEGKKGYTAAGKYQILASNWAHYAPMAGVSDFQPASQDKVAWVFAQDVYRRTTGRSLIDDVKDEKMHPYIVRALAPTWNGLGANPSKALGTLTSVYKQSGGQQPPVQGGDPNAPNVEATPQGNVPQQNAGEIPQLKEGGMVPENSNPRGTLALLHPGELVVPQSKLSDIASIFDIEEQQVSQTHHTELVPIIIYA